MTNRASPTNSDDVIDSRDIIHRMSELESEREALAERLNEVEGDANQASAKANLDDWDLDNGAELTALQSLAAEAKGYTPDWEYGATLIRESYFVEYAEELTKDIGDMPEDIPSYIEIDWDATARNIRVDYTEVDFDGVTYLVR